MDHISNVSSKCNLEQVQPSNIVNISDEKTVIVLGKENLLGSVVELLLDAAKTWKIIRMTDEIDTTTCLTNIRKLNPQIVIICQNDSSIQIELLMQLLDEQSGLKIITVGLENNSIQIYNKQRVWIRNSVDFLSILDSKHQSQESQNLETHYQNSVKE